jgi:hypothetical protein
VFAELAGVIPGIPPTAFGQPFPKGCIRLDETNGLSHQLAAALRVRRRRVAPPIVEECQAQGA